MMLSACDGSQNIDTSKPSLVVGSGPYHEQFVKQPSLLYRSLTGDENPDHKLIILRTGWVFENDSNPEQKFDMLFAAPSQGRYAPRPKLMPEAVKNMERPMYQVKSVVPGTYHLTQIRLGARNYDYDAEKCGAITLKINVGEAVYMGSIYPPDDFIHMNYSSFRPQFKSEGTPTFEGGAFYFNTEAEKNWIRSRKSITRLPVVSEATHSSEPCEDKFKPLLDRL